MRDLMMGIALVAVLGAAPAIAAEKAHKSTSISQEDQNRFQNDDGTFQGKPVVQGPASWHNMEPGALGSSSSSGGSSGESGSSSDHRPNMK